MRATYGNGTISFGRQNEQLGADGLKRIQCKRHLSAYQALPEDSEVNAPSHAVLQALQGPICQLYTSQGCTLQESCSTSGAVWVHACRHNGNKPCLHAVLVRDASINQRERESAKHLQNTVFGWQKSKRNKHTYTVKLTYGGGRSLKLLSEIMISKGFLAENSTEGCTVSSASFRATQVAVRVAVPPPHATEHALQGLNVHSALVHAPFLHK